MPFCLGSALCFGSPCVFGFAFAFAFAGAFACCRGACCVCVSRAPRALCARSPPLDPFAVPVVVIAAFPTNCSPFPPASARSLTRQLERGFQDAEVPHRTGRSPEKNPFSNHLSSAVAANGPCTFPSGPWYCQCPSALACSPLAAELFPFFGTRSTLRVFESRLTCIFSPPFLPLLSATPPLLTASDACAEAKPDLLSCTYLSCVLRLSLDPSLLSERADADRDG